MPPPVISFRSVSVHDSLGFAQDVTKALEETAIPVFRQWAQELLDEEIARRKAEGEDEPYYSVNVDGTPNVPRSTVAGARRRVIYEFLWDIVQVGLAEMTQIMQRSIARGASPRSWIQKQLIASKVRVFYGSKEGMREVSSSADIKNFQPGEYIYLVPDATTQVYANASKYGASHFMANASASIRRKAKITKSTSSLRVSAVRSRAVWERLQVINRPRSGTPIKATIQGQNQRGPTYAWAIAIRYRSGVKRRVPR